MLYFFISTEQLQYFAEKLPRVPLSVTPTLPANRGHFIYFWSCLEIRYGETFLPDSNSVLPKFLGAEGLVERREEYVCFAHSAVDPPTLERPVDGFPHGAE